MTGVDDLAGALCLCAAGLILLAAVHKGRAVALGTAVSQPLMQLSDWRREHAAPLLAMLGACELVVVAALVLEPAAGMGGALALLALYTWELRRLAPDEHCDCFGNFLRTERNVALRRNVLLMAALGASLTATLLGAAEPVTGSQPAIGVALVAAAITAGIEAMPRVAPRAGVAADGQRRGGRFASQ